MPVLQKSISCRHSNVVVVLVQVNVDNSITEGEEKRKIVASSCKGPGLSSESENQYATTVLMHRRYAHFDSCAWLKKR